MQKTQFFLFLLATMLLSGCGAIETIFKAGMWWAFFRCAGDSDRNCNSKKGGKKIITLFRCANFSPFSERDADLFGSR